jgi:hypothetical protein
MTVLSPRIWYVCNKCEEWFRPENCKKSEKCPDCKKGVLIKTCAFCGEEFDKCKCSKQKLSQKCHKCGFFKSNCKCK